MSLQLNANKQANNVKHNMVTCSERNQDVSIFLKFSLEHNQAKKNKQQQQTNKTTNEFNYSNTSIDAGLCFVH